MFFTAVHCPRNKGIAYTMNVAARHPGKSGKNMAVRSPADLSFRRDNASA
ncbi:MAG: hypothetical protein WDM96_11375 [Lacunisphaera sp.]